MGSCDLQNLDARNCLEHGNVVIRARRTTVENDPEQRVCLACIAVNKPGMVEHVCDPGTQGGEAGSRSWLERWLGG